MDDLWRQKVAVLGEHISAAVLHLAGKMADLETERVAFRSDIQPGFDVGVELLCGGEKKKTEKRSMGVPHVCVEKIYRSQLTINDAVIATWLKHLSRRI